jgi:hypothetical protein
MLSTKSWGFAEPQRQALISVGDGDILKHELRYHLLIDFDLQWVHDGE